MARRRLARPLRSALTFYLWVFALERTTPTRVAATMTVNPPTAAIVAAILIGESIGLDLLFGVAPFSPASRSPRPRDGRPDPI